MTEGVYMDIFLARQAIFDSNYKSVAYELLFRNSKENRFDFSVDADTATMKLISNCMSFGLQELTNDKMAFINFTNGLIKNEYPSILPKDIIVIEILESVKPTKDIIKALSNLKTKGYTIALDDVIANTKYWEYGNIIDIYKIDFRASTQEERVDLIKGIKVLNPNAKLLAEKVETHEEYQEALNNNYSYTQGYYFSKPLMMTGKEMPIRNKTCFNIMAELLNNDFNINKIEEIIKSDVSMSYKLIKMLNSASFSFSEKITSIKQAIILIGKEELNKWLTITAMSEMESGEDKEVTTATIVKARFCELIAEQVAPEQKSKCFMCGLFSNLDTFIEKRMDEIVDDLPIDDELKDALVGEENIINIILQLVEAYEKVEDEKIIELSKKLKIDKNILVELYVKSINWERNLYNGLNK
jgi:EAL and modified HD-GYP domain-containing signal transduction protein